MLVKKEHGRPRKAAGPRGLEGGEEWDISVNYISRDYRTVPSVCICT